MALRLLAASETACKTMKLFTSANTSNVASQRLIAKAGFFQAGLSRTRMRMIRSWFISNVFGE
ncbi:hypothetical protein [Pseudomonas sp. B6001]|uniref:hypothetical protein n=1 Tax=Pseudomonas sp. B6001 TaxID=2738813 RepID=UPI003528720A